MTRDSREDTRPGVWITHQGSDVSVPRCQPISCDEPPLVEHAVMELVNGSTGLHMLLVYSCEAGYYDQMSPQSVSVSQCQTDQTWSPVNLRFVKR